MGRRTTPTAEPPEQEERFAPRRDRFRIAHDLDERLQLLVSFGLTDQDIAKVVPNVGARSVRRWRTVGPPSTRKTERWEPIDDLWAIVGCFLADATYDEQNIVAWMRSRHPALAHRRPLDVLGEKDLEAVRAAAEEKIYSHARSARKTEDLPEL